MRFRQCMTRGLSLVKLHVVDTIQKLSVEMIPSVKDVSDISHQDLYDKFRAPASQLQELLVEIESRAENHREYVALLRDCYNAFFISRTQLLGPIVGKHIQNLSQSSLVEFVLYTCHSLDFLDSRRLQVCCQGVPG